MDLALDNKLQYGQKCFGDYTIHIQHFYEAANWSCDYVIVHIFTNQEVLNINR